MLTIINDTHIGANRSAGTTPHSQFALKQALHSGLRALLPTEGDLLINGDLFDTNNVSLWDVMETFYILDDWLKAHPTSNLYNSRGNHDASKNSVVLSSFDFLGGLLTRAHPQAYKHIVKPLMTEHGYIIPHCLNQDAFNQELIEVPACDYLFLHCNYDNGFAAELDHSLNLSADQAAALTQVRKHIVLGHEHHPNTHGKIQIPGNQLATSVGDWQQGADKGFLRIVQGEIEYVTWATKADQYVEMPYDRLEFTDHPFVKVIGQAAAEDTGKIVTLLNRYRSKSTALVVTNGVKFISEDTGAIMEQNLQSVETYSIWNALEAILTADEIADVKKANEA